MDINLKKNGENISIGYICESGDGYIRFSNGIQMCYGHIKWNEDDSNKKTYRIVTYPKAFKTFSNIDYDVPFIFVQPNQRNSKDGIAKLSVEQTMLEEDSSGEIMLNNSSQCAIIADKVYTSGLYVWYLVIGRWK